MDYNKGYMTASSLADRIREEASAGKKVKTGSGLASRMARTEQKLEGFNDILPQYINFTRELFAPVAAQRQGMIPSSPSQSGRATGYSASLSGAISADVGDKGIRRILSALKSKESGGDYNAKNTASTASGGYQFIDSTWRSLSNKYGVGTEYKTAKSAPTDVQDIVAARYVADILAENNNYVTKVPVVWYTGNAAGSMSEEALAVNKGLTAERYQADWLRRYNAISGE
jgi:muramidase (phage lysozyme)